MKVFGHNGPKFLTIPPGVGFLDTLADRLVEEFDLSNEPDALAKALIYLPNRKSALSLTHSIHKASGGKAIIAPEIRALGNVEDDEPPNPAEAHLGPNLPVLEQPIRVGKLASLCQNYQRRNGIDSPVAAINSAKELAGLLDQATINGEIDWEILDENQVDNDLSEHWRQNLEFLKIITEKWPEYLRDNNVLDRHEKRLKVAIAVAASWEQNPPKTPVIIAGSTGSVKVSRVLMAAAAKLPLGRVIFPGLDNEVLPESWKNIGTSPGHPQYAFVKTINELGITLDDVQHWPTENHPTINRARRLLVNESLAPAIETADWLSKIDVLAKKQKQDVANFARDALQGLTLIEAADEAEEARIVSLILRETLENKREKAVLVTNDTGLERRTVSNLKRWDVHVKPAGGTPLLQTEAGSFADLVLDWLRDPSCPIAIASLCKHKFVTRHINRKGDNFYFNRFEKRFLRGVKRWNSLAEMRCRYEKESTEISRRSSQRNVVEERKPSQSILNFIDFLQDAADEGGSKFTSGEYCSMTDLCKCWVEVIQKLTYDGEKESDIVWNGTDGSKLRQAINDLYQMIEPIETGTAEHLQEIFRNSAKGLNCVERNFQSRINIWRALEARLQSADQVVLAGLNEGVWPSQPNLDSFLPRQLYAVLGMSDPEHRLGLTAHDFSQLACAPNVTLVYTRRRDGSPAIASRWIWRLKTLAEGALTKEGANDAFAPPKDNNPLAWASSLTKLKKSEDADFATPNPKPPVNARPNRLSVTRINVLQRDPYAIYAENILNLSPLDPLDAEIDARPIGSAVHKAVEKFELNHEDGIQDRNQLLELMESELKAAGVSESNIKQLWAVRRKACERYLVWRKEQLVNAETIGIESYGAWTLSLAEGLEFRVTGQADRIDKLSDGTLAIYDFKTGNSPTDIQINAGLEQQMPLLALIASEGEIEGLSPTTVSKLGYIKLGTSFGERIIGESSKSPLAELTIPEITARTREGLKKLAESYLLSQDQAYLSAPRVKWITYDFGFNRLARRDEWVWKTDSDIGDGQ